MLPRAVSRVGRSSLKKMHSAFGDTHWVNVSQILEILAVEEKKIEKEKAYNYYGSKEKFESFTGVNSSSTDDDKNYSDAFLLNRELNFLLRQLCTNGSFSHEAAGAHHKTQPDYAVAYAERESFRRVEEMVDLLGRMAEVGARPTGIRDIKNIIKLLVRDRRTDELRRVVGSLRDTGLDSVGLSVFTELMVKRRNAGEVDECNVILEELKNVDPVPNVVLYNVLMDAYGKAGRLTDCRNLLDEMYEVGVKPDVISFSSFMHAALRQQDVEGCQRIFEEMLSADVTPNLITFDLLINGFSRLRRLNESMEMFQQMARAGFAPRLWTCNNLLKRLGASQEGENNSNDDNNIGGKSGRRLADIRAVLDTMARAGVSPDVASYTMYMQKLLRGGLQAEAQETLREMISAGVKPSQVTCNLLINEVSRLGDLDGGLEILQQMTRVGLRPVIVTYNNLLKRLCNDPGRLGDMRVVLQSMTSGGVDPNVVTYTLFIKKLLQEGEYSEVRRTLSEMSAAGVAPNQVTFGVLMDSFGRAGNLGACENIMGVMRRSGLRPNVHIYSMKLRVLCKLGRVEDARRVLDEMRGEGLVPTIVTYNTLMDGLRRSNLDRECEDLLEEMRARGVAPNARTYSSLLSSLLTRPGGGGERSAHLLQRMLGDGIPLNIFTFTTLIRHLGSHSQDGRVVEETAGVLRDQMREAGVVPNVAWYNALLHARVRAGGWAGMGLRDVWGDLREMRAVGLRPNVVTYNTLLGGVGRRGEVDACFDIVKLMRKAGVPPNEVTVKILGRWIDEFELKRAEAGRSVGGWWIQAGGGGEGGSEMPAQQVLRWREMLEVERQRLPREGGVDEGGGVLRDGVF